MPNSYKDYDDATASTTSVTFTTGDFEYLDTAHLKVIVTNTGNVSTEFLQTSTGQDNTNPPFTVAASSGTTTVTFNNMNGVTGSGLPANTDKVRVQRVTPSASLLTTFQNASLLRADDLNDNAKQLLFVLQEQVDAGTGSLPLNAAGFFDAGAKKIANIADGTAEQDVASFGQLSALSAFSADAPTVPQFTTFAGTDGTFASGNTTFNIPFTPLSEIDATYICEVGGVVQVPGADFTVAGTTLTIIGRNVTNSGANAENIAKIVLQSFGVTKSVFNFPTTGTAASNSETPITLKGATSGDGTAMLSVKDSSNVENASITAGGNVKAKVVEPNAGGDLAVNPSTITTTGTITSGGNLTVGSASITQATGDATVNNLTISSATQTSTQAVPKSYVDAKGGFEGSAIGADTDLDTVLTPGLYTGTVNSPSTQNYPGTAGAGELFVMRVTRAGGLAGTSRIQEFINASDAGLVHIRHYDGSAFGPWKRQARRDDNITNFALPNANLNMNSNKITNVADNTAAQDAVTQNHLQTNYKTNSEIIDHVGKYFGPFRARAVYKVCENVDPQGVGSSRLFQLNGGTSPALSSVLDPYSITSGINMVPISGTSSDPETFNNGGGTGGQDDIENPFLLEIPAGLGPVQLLLYARPIDGSSAFNFRMNQYTAQTALTATKNPIGTFGSATFSSPLNRRFYIPNLTATRYFGVEGYVSSNSGTNEDIPLNSFYIDITRPASDFSGINYFVTQA